jgi:urease accessory protein
MRRRSSARTLLGALFVVAASHPAAAHIGHGDITGFAHGFLHPFGGLDHILAMVSVGMLAALVGPRLGARSVWVFPVAFMVMMSVGAGLAMADFNLPFVEIGISLSVVALGVAVAVQMPLPLVAGVLLVGFFAVFHGFAHGAEMRVGDSMLTYWTGFLVATALLHLAGVASSVILSRWALAGTIAPRVAGMAIAVAGIGLVAAG